MNKLIAFKLFKKNKYKNLMKFFHKLWKIIIELIKLKIIIYDSSKPYFYFKNKRNKLFQIFDD